MKRIQLPPNHKLIIAIDGYSSCGKSTLAKDLAKYLGYKYVNSGAMYRAATYIAVSQGLLKNGNLNVNALVKKIKSSIIDFEYNEELGRFETFLNDTCIEDDIRDLAISEKVSHIAKNREVRSSLVEKQRNFSTASGLVMEGRDIGTVVLPHADIKIFMTANVIIRAQRRYLEWKKKDKNITLQQVMDNITKRDKLDEERKESPLKKAKDSILLDNSYLNLEEQLYWVLKEVEGKFTAKTLKIFLDKSAGYCFGVTKAISKAEEELQNVDKLLVIGDIVHNSEETDRLKKKGLHSIDHKEFAKLKDTKVLIRAHGEPPSTYEMAKKNKIKLIDQSCPIVLNVQKKLKKIYEEMKDEGAQIVLFGKKGHPEILGLLGQINHQAIVIENITQTEDLCKLDFTKPIILFSQTTKSAKGYEELAKLLKSKSQKEIRVVDTICRIVSNRVPKLREFARRHDVILFVSDTKSSNGNLLYKISKNENPNSYFLSSIEDIDFSWFDKAKTVGISGATSTPEWLIKDIYSTVENYSP